MKSRGIPELFYRDAGALFLMQSISSTFAGGKLGGLGKLLKDKELVNLLPGETCVLSTRGTIYGNGLLTAT